MVPDAGTSACDDCDFLHRGTFLFSRALSETFTGRVVEAVVNFFDVLI
jgi:hypothetical protein|tara:strand:- start:284 stop:427 length:144 start_codon:yes stop_codon:yes gene_type:complete